MTRDELLKAFGDEGLFQLDVEHARERGLRDGDARLLSESGLPVRADVAFTTFVDGELPPGAPVVFQTGDGEVDVLILGAVAPDGYMRYFLDLKGGSVGLLDFGEPKTERVNSSLENFVEFLYRIRVRQQELTDAAGDLDNRQYTEKLWLSLKELDPVAVSSGEAWWSMVMDNFMERSFVDETRAFLQQRRAEVAGALEELEELADQSPGGGFERAIGNLLKEGCELVDAEQFAADNENYGLLHLPADLDEYFDDDGALVKDVRIAWKGALPSKIQSLLARQGLVGRVSSESNLVDDDALYAMSDEEREKYMETLMEVEPGEGTVTCLAGDETSDLCRIVGALDRLGAQGYVAEPDLWPVSSGAWQQVQERTKPGQPVKAVFWTTQSHTGSFDDRGDLAGELYLQWAGDADEIAEALRETGLVVDVPEDDGTAFVLRPVS